MADEAGPPQAPVDKANEISTDGLLKVYLGYAIEQFGPIPRDVYDSISNFEKTRKRHAEAFFGLTYDNLMTLINAFGQERRFDVFSHRLIAVEPHQISDSVDAWLITFKSVRIGKELVELMQSEEDKSLVRTYDTYHKFTEGFTLAGWIFEAFAHRMFSHGYKHKQTPQQPIHISSSSDKPHVFSTDLPYLSTNIASPLCDDTRATTSVDFTSDHLSEVTLGEGKYYKPTTNNPLFDSFIIDHNPHQHTVIVSVFQMTITKRQGGSKKGCNHIIRIVDYVSELLRRRNLNDTVEVRYFLVCPDDGSSREWVMPEGWDKKTAHCGDVFCLRIPMSVCRTHLLPTLRPS